MEEVLGEYWPAEGRRIRAVVAYTDEFAHCGAGKELWWRQCHALNIQPKMGYDAGNERAERNYKTFCTAYVPEPLNPNGGQSLRRLQIGRSVYWLEYSSSESWMSNFGEGDCAVAGQEPDAGYHPVIRLPLWAVDFVWGKAGLYAVDFNTAPGIRGSGVEKLLPGEAAVAALEQALNELEPGCRPELLIKNSEAGRASPWITS